MNLMLILKQYTSLCILPLFVCLLFISCQKDKFPYGKEKDYENVDQELWSFFYQFELEAAKRGVTIDLVELKISGQVENIIDPAYIGLCSYPYSERPGRIVIDELFWQTASQTRKELAVFHELGHCALGRSHNDEVRSFGICESVMRSGQGNCLIDYHNHRSDYLDELFNN